MTDIMRVPVHQTYGVGAGGRSPLMTQSLNFEDYSATLAVRFPGVPALNVEDHMATLYLYHAPNSICSQKVRAVPAAKKK